MVYRNNSTLCDSYPLQRQKGKTWLRTLSARIDYSMSIPVNVEMLWDIEKFEPS